MSIKGFFGSVALATPTLVLGYVSSWSDLFKNTLIMRPGASDQVSNTGIAFSCLLAIVLALLYKQLPAKSLKTVALCLLSVAVLLAFICYWIRFKYHYPLPRETQELLNFWWDGASWLFIVAINQMVLFATMFANATWARPGQEQPSPE